MAGELRALNCPCCGGILKHAGKNYSCDYCGKSFEDVSFESYADGIRALFGEVLYNDKCEKIAALKRNLYSALHAEHIESREISDICREIKKILPEDFQACFYDLANTGTAKEINAFLLSCDSSAKPFAGDVVEFLLKGLENSNVLPLKQFISEFFTGEQFVKYTTAVEDEAEKLQAGVYSPQLPRDVFLAYSSKDAAAVNTITEYLESKSITCFVAMRNLRHGRGAVENYLGALHTAMKNCKCVVFLSTENSRDLDCDALREELPYIAENIQGLGRIEYLLEEYGEHTSYAAKKILEGFFAGLEYCRTKEDLVDRIVGYITGVHVKDIKNSAHSKKDGRAQYKYCLSCLMQVPSQAEECPSCGAKQFFNGTPKELKEYLEMKNSGKPTIASKIRREFEGVKELIKSTADAAVPTARTKDYKIKNGCLKGYTGLLPRADIPAGVQRICKGAFERNVVLDSLRTPQSLQYVERGAFKKCVGLRHVTFFQGLSVIEGGAFKKCPSLVKVYIPAGVGYIGKKAFKKCPNVVIYCEDISRPKSWDKDWDKISAFKRAEVVWGYKNKNRF